MPRASSAGMSPNAFSQKGKHRLCYHDLSDDRWMLLVTDEGVKRRIVFTRCLHSLGQDNPPKSGFKVSETKTVMSPTKYYRGPVSCLNGYVKKLACLPGLDEKHGSHKVFHDWSRVLAMSGMVWEMLKVFRLCLVARGALSGANTLRLPFGSKPMALSPEAKQHPNTLSSNNLSRQSH